jgi:hypothetical protein
MPNHVVTWDDVLERKTCVRAVAEDRGVQGRVVLVDAMLLQLAESADALLDGF